MTAHLLASQLESGLQPHQNGEPEIALKITNHMQ